MRTDLFCKQTSLNLVVFDKNEGNFREKKDISKNVKSQFVNGGLHVVRLISWIVLCCCVILMQNLIEFLKNTVTLFLKLISVIYLWIKIRCLMTATRTGKRHSLRDCLQPGCKDFLSGTLN